MQRRDFFYELSPDLIAQHPLERRSASRLLHFDRRSGELNDCKVAQLPDLLLPKDLLIFNDTKVLKARLFARKETGGRVEILIERVTGAKTAVAQLGASKPTRSGAVLKLDGGPQLRVGARVADGMHELHFEGEQSVVQILDATGHVPLPPYIRRKDAANDGERYQTVFARIPGAVAAPTAGLHFDTALLAALEARGVEIGFITLHVGAGTFLPVRTDRIEDHRMHAESFEINEDTCRQIETARTGGGRVVAVGTTVVRALESAALGDGLQAGRRDTEIFIYPGYRFRVIDAMITNFHLPESTLLMLVAAFAGKERIMEAYAHAIGKRYRFYSYGDAMLIT